MINVENIEYDDCHLQLYEYSVYKHNGLNQTLFYNLNMMDFAFHTFIYKTRWNAIVYKYGEKGYFKMFMEDALCRFTREF